MYLLFLKEKLKSENAKTPPPLEYVWAAIASSPAQLGMKPEPLPLFEATLQLC